MVLSLCYLIQYETAVAGVVFADVVLLTVVVYDLVRAHMRA